MKNDIFIAISMILFTIITFLTILLIGETIAIIASAYSPSLHYCISTLACLSLWVFSLWIVIQEKETNAIKTIY